MKCFPSILHRRNLKTQQSPVISDLRLKKTRSGTSYDYREAIVLQRLGKSYIFKMIFVYTETKSRHIQIPRTVGLTVEINLRFEIPPALSGQDLGQIYNEGN